MGMPLNISEIEKDINRRISETSYSNVDKKILELYLENKQKELDGSTASIFEYQDLGLSRWRSGVFYYTGFLYEMDLSINCRGFGNYLGCGNENV